LTKFKSKKRYVAEKNRRIVFAVAQNSEAVGIMEPINADAEADVDKIMEGIACGKSQVPCG
jgi:hypothetical protein